MGTMFKTVLKLSRGFTLAMAAQKQTFSYSHWKYGQHKCNPKGQKYKEKELLQSWKTK